MKNSIHVQREYNATVEELWELIATCEGLSSWLMPNDFAPIVGDTFTFTDKPHKPFYDGIVGCTVLAVEPMAMLRFSWVGGPIDTVVEFRLTGLDSGRTRLDVQQTGFSGLKSQAVRAILDLGWRDLLRRKLASHCG
jgi:uncharacterized protein YndB with AHSA1/START domain